MKIGRTSFSKEGYEAFKLLSKEEQVNKIGNDLYPKDNDKATKLLAHIPHGESISSGNDKEVNSSDTSNTARNIKDNPKKPRTNQGESAGVQEGGEA